jgi:hypothetical protein
MTMMMLQHWMLKLLHEIHLHSHIFSHISYFISHMLEHYTYYIEFISLANYLATHLLEHYTMIDSEDDFLAYLDNGDLSSACTLQGQFISAI